MTLRGGLRAALSLLLVTAMVAAAPANAPAVASRAASSPWSGPWHPTISKAQAERFVTLWLARLADREWFGRYLRSPEVPPEVLAEGYHGLDEHTKRYLIDRIFARAARLDPSFAAEMRRISPQEADRRKMLLYLYIFDKAWVRSLQERATAKAAPPAPAESVPVSDALRARIEELKAIRAISVPQVTPPARLMPRDPSHLSASKPAASVRAKVGSPLALSETPARAGTVELPAVGPAPRITIPVAAAGGATDRRVSLPETDIALPPIPGEVAGLLQQVTMAADLATYRVCAESASLALTCSPDVGLGTPVPMDVNGDLVPDVTAQLSPTVDPAYPLGVSVAFQVLRTNPLADPLPGHVFAVFEVPQAMLRMAVGSDGRASTLAARAAVTATLTDLAQALAGRIEARMSITHDAPGTEQAVSFAVSRLVYSGIGAPVEVDPAAGLLSFTPVPESFQTSVVLNRLPGQDEYLIGVRSSVPSRLNATLSVDGGGGSFRHEMQAVVDRLPTSVDVRFAQSGGTLQATYTADATIDRVAYRHRYVPSLASPGDYQVASAEVQDVPQQVAFSLTPPMQVHYEASSRLTAASVRLDTYQGGSLARSLGGRVENLPTRIDLSVAPPAPDAPGTVVTYRADGVLGRLAFGMVDLPRDRTVASAEVVGLPEELTVTVQPSGASLEANQPITSISGALSTLDTPAVSFADDHLSFRQTAGMAASFKISSLRQASVLQSRGTVSASFAFPGRGRRPLRAYFETPSITAAGYVSNLPETFTIQTRPTSFTWRSSDPIDLLAVHARASDAAADATLEGIPTSVDLSWAGGTVGSVAYRASAPILRLAAQLATGNLTAGLAVSSIPTQIDVSWNTTSQVVNLSANAPIGSILASLGLAGGSGGSIPRRDYLVVRKDGPSAGVGLKISGLKALAADSAQGVYSLTFSPGGQPFTAVADLDSDISGLLELAAMPSTMSVDLRPGNRRFLYTASAPIPSLRAQLAKASAGLSTMLSLTGLPASVDVSWTDGTSPVVTYTASGTLGAVEASVRAPTGAFDADIQSIPPYMRIASAANSFSFDARTSPSDPPASAAVGSILLRYGSNGTFLSGTPAEDHAILRQTATTTHAELLYRGLKAASLSAANGEVHASLQNTSPRLMRAYLETPTAVAWALIDAVPASLRLDVAPVPCETSPCPPPDSTRQVTYRASSAVNRIAVSSSRPGGPSLDAELVGLPSSIDATVTPQSLGWTASAPITSLSAATRVLSGGRTWDATVEITGVPAQWSASFAGDHPLFRGISGPLGSLAATITNHGVIGVLSGNHLAAFFDQGTGDLDASLRMTAINLAELQKTASGWRADLRAGAGAPFAFAANIRTGATLANVRGTMSAFPTSIQVTQSNDAISVTTDRNFDLVVSAEVGNAGAVAAAPAPPFVHGVAVRDGSGCVGTTCGTGVKAKLYLTGLPTSVSVDPTPPNLATDPLIQITNFRPSVSSLTLDAELDNLTSPYTRLLAVQQGIPSPISFSLGPLYTQTAGSSKRTRARYTASASMGAFTADLIWGSDVGRLEISNIPSTIDATITLDNPTSSVNLTLLPSGINRLAAYFRRTADSTFQGGVELREIPSSVNLSFGRVTVGGITAPGLTYSASASTLDVTAFVEAALMGGDVRAKVTMGITDLGASTSVGLSGNQLRLTSSPSTTNLEIHTWGQINYSKSFGSCPGPGGFHLDVCGSVNLNPLTIEDLGLQVQNFSSVTATLGLTTALQGNFGSFRFGWDRISVHLIFDFRVEACWDFGILGKGCEPVVSVHYDNTFDVHIWFHIGGQHEQSDPWWSLTLDLVVCKPGLRVYITPHPHFKSLDGFQVGNPSGEGGAWTITPNPGGVFSDFVVQAAAALTDPLGGGLRFDWDWC